VSAPVFVDAIHASETLGVPREQILDWIASGKLRRFGGKPDNPFVRSADVAALAAELGVSTIQAAPRKVKSGSARVQARLTADSRWAEIGEADIRDWARRADEQRRQAARKAAEVARRRLEDVLRVLDEVG
jgi:hypothetical protein